MPVRPQPARLAMNGSPLAWRAGAGRGSALAIGAMVLAGVLAGSLAGALAAPRAVPPPRVKVVFDFEQEADLKAWEFKAPGAVLSDAHATHGRRSLKLPAEQYMSTWRLPKDWSGFDALELDVFVEGEGTVGGTLLIGDEAWRKSGGSYWNRHNGGFTLRPGANTLSIPVNGLYRGEAGSRGNGLKSNIDPTQIIRVDLGFTPRPGEHVAALYLDQVRLVKESRPEGILAFDFGPESQVVAPGFTPIGPNTVYGKNGTKAGFKWALGANAGRDDTFPTRLYQDYVSMEGAEFVADVPAGAAGADGGGYGMWVVFDDLGYWGGEQARFSRRSIWVNGQTVWQEDRGPGGPADYLFRFEPVEPRPGDSPWDLYVRDLFKPARFEARAVGGKLAMRVNSDGALGCKVAAVVIYPLGRKAEAEAWVAEVERRNRAEFEARATYLGPAPRTLEVPAGQRGKDFWVGYPSLEQDVRFFDPPGAEAGELSRPAARGQRVSMTFAIRPLKEGPDAAGRAMALQGTDLRRDEAPAAAGNANAPEAKIPFTAVDARYVHHALHRGPNDIAYSIGPETLRHLPADGLELRPDLTRQFWVTVHVPPGTPAGVYRGQVILSAERAKLSLPLIVRVLDFALDEPDFAMGYYGTGVPREVSALRPGAAGDLLRTLREAGMNSLSGGPSIPFSGLAADGTPRLDFTACDEFFRLVKEAGFTQPLDAYGGPGMVVGLHDGYVIGQTGRDWEKKTGKPFGELLKIVWSAVRDHAEREHWPAVRLETCDEPRVVESAKEELELMKAYRQNVPWVPIGGSYSVNWKGDDEFDRAVREMFRTLAWSALNLHSQVDLDKAKEYGKELLVYNQGRSRYSFGAYQWAEMRKGVRGRMQWHLLALHGYQFFDLDGREPDTATINWGRDEIIPTIALPRCREGSDDFRYAVTLWNLANRHPESPAGAEAKVWLEGVSAKIGVNQTQRPAGFMDDEAFRNGCIERIEKLRTSYK